eukprot:5124820-Amphidinium_carterae.1
MECEDTSMQRASPLMRLRSAAHPRIEARTWGRTSTKPQIVTVKSPSAAKCKSSKECTTMQAVSSTITIGRDAI